jgi:hypothetical protein
VLVPIQYMHSLRASRQAGSGSGGTVFATTHWSVVLEAGREASPAADEVGPASASIRSGRFSAIC